MAVILADGIFKCILINGSDKIPIQISLKLMPKSPIDNKPALVQLGNGLAPNRRKAIMSNNDDPVQWHINVALQGDELRFETWKAIENAAFNTDILVFIQASVS